LETLLTVSIIGAGRLGRSLAVLCARAGYSTVLEDVMPANLRRAADEFGRDIPEARMRYAQNIEDAVREADLVIDCVPDELESKLEIFSLLDRMAPPRTIFCTPTRALSIADLASCTYRPDRCVALQLPESLLQYGGASGAAEVVIVQTSRTAPEVSNAVVCFCRALNLEVRVEWDAMEIK
jgi:3-hydroxybutyryl-CoA dehydrogenase